MAEQTTISWFGIRTVYHFGKKRDGTNIFEERVVVFSGATQDEAFEKADKEADEYCAALGHTCHSWMEAYSQDDEPLIDGYEVWSMCFEFTGDLDEFVASRYERFRYHPDT